MRKTHLLISNIVKLFTLSPTANVTVVLTGTESDWDYIVIQDPPKNSNNYVRFIHLSPDVEEVDVVSSQITISKTDIHPSTSMEVWLLRMYPTNKPLIL